MCFATVSEIKNISLVTSYCKGYDIFTQKEENGLIYYTFVSKKHHIIQENIPFLKFLQGGDVTLEAHSPSFQQTAYYAQGIAHS